MRHTASGATAPRARRRNVFVAATAVAVGLFGNASAGQAGNQSGLPSLELDATVSQYIASWNTHDPAVLVGAFTADADMIMGNGPLLRGRAAIRDWWRAYFEVQEPERQLTIEALSARPITTDVALVNIRTTTGGRAAQGSELRSRTARGTWVLVRRDGAWLISAMRGMPTEQDRIIRAGG